MPRDMDTRSSRKKDEEASSTTTFVEPIVYEEDRFEFEGVSTRARRSVSDGHLVLSGSAASSAPADTGYWVDQQGHGRTRTVPPPLIHGAGVPYHPGGPDRAHPSPGMFAHHSQSHGPPAPPGFVNLSYAAPQWSPKLDLNQQPTYSPSMHPNGSLGPMHSSNGGYSPGGHSSSSYFQPQPQYSPAYHSNPLVRHPSSPDFPTTAIASYHAEADEAEVPSSRSSTRSADEDQVRSPIARSLQSPLEPSGVAAGPNRSHSRRAKIAAEKARRDQLQEWFRQLAILFPVGDGGGRPSKKFLISQAVKTLHSLQEENNQLHYRLSELERMDGLPSSRGPPSGGSSGPSGSFH